MMKHLRWLMSSLLCVVLIISLVACRDDSSGSDNSKDVEQLKDTVEKMDEPTKEAMKSISESDSDESTESSASASMSSDTALEALVTSPEKCKKFGGYYVIRNGKNYAVGGKIPSDQAERIGIGQPNYDIYNSVFLYTYWDNHDIVSTGNVPVLTLQDGDKIVRYGDTKLGISPVSEPIPSLRIAIGGSYSEKKMILYSKTDEFGEYEYIKLQYANQIQLEDSHGNVIPFDQGYSDQVKFGENYKLEFFYGQTDYREYDMVADSWYY